MYQLISNEAGETVAFETLTDEQHRQALHESWCPAHLREFNAAHERCSACDGWGSLRSKQGGRYVRENTGCPECQGLCVVPKPKLWEGRL